MATMVLCLVIAAYYFGLVPPSVQPVLAEDLVILEQKQAQSMQGILKELDMRFLYIQQTELSSQLQMTTDLLEEANTSLEGDPTNLHIQRRVKRLETRIEKLDTQYETVSSELDRAVRTRTSMPPE